MNLFSKAKERVEIKVKRRRIFVATLSLIVSCAIMFSVIPFASFFATANEIDYSQFCTAFVICGDKVIVDAEVTLFVSEELSFTAKTDEKGYAVFEDMTEYLQKEGEINVNGYKVVPAPESGFEKCESKEVYHINEGEKCIEIRDMLEDIGNPVINDIFSDPSADKYTRESVVLTVDATDNLAVTDYSLGGLEWQAENTFEVTENGSYDIYVRDAKNHQDKKTFNVENIDKVPPEIVDHKITWDAENNKYIVEIIAKDEKSGIKEENGYGLVKEDGNILWQNENKFLVDFDEKDKEFKYVVVDKCENQTEPQVMSIKDEEAPVITGVTIDPTTWTNEAVTFIVEATDNIGVVEYAMTDDGVAPEDKDWQKSNIFKVTDKKVHNFYARDGFLTSAPFKSDSAKFDNIKPTIEVKSPNTGLTPSPALHYVQKEYLTITAKDDEGGSGLKEVRLSFNGQKEKAIENVHEYVAEENGEYVFVAVDVAGNRSCPFTVNVNCIDKIAPEISEVVQETEVWTSDPIEFTVYATDEPSKTVKKYAMKDNSEQPGVSDDCWQESCVFNVSDCKNHYFFAMDEAGNISEAYNIEGKDTLYDNVPPELISVTFNVKNNSVVARVLNFLSFGVFFNKKATVTVIAEDNDADGRSGSSGVKSYTVSWYNGKGCVKTVVQQKKDENGNIFDFDYDEISNFKGIIKVKICDIAGNDTEEISVTTDNSNLEGFDEFMIENDAPVISVVEKPEIVNEDFEFKFGVSDKTDNEWSGLNSVKVFVNGTETLNKYYEDKTGSDEFSLSTEFNFDEHTVSVNDVKVPWNRSEEEKGVEEKGVLEYVVEVIDNSGNASTTSEVYYIDKTAPVITGFDFNLSKNDETGLYNAVETGDYGFYFKEDVTVTVKAEDKVGNYETKSSGVKSITYKVVDVDPGKGETTNTVDVDENGEISFEVKSNFKGMIYAYATDKLGNKDEKFVHPDGTVIESAEKHNEDEHVEIIQKDSAPYKQNDGTDLYSGNAEVIINASDKYSGIGKIEVKVKSPFDTANNRNLEIVVDNSGRVVEHENENQIDLTDTVKDEDKDQNLVTRLSRTITVANNSNDIVVEVKLTDRAGNDDGWHSIKFGIDKTAPTVQLEYMTNETHDEAYANYFRTNRVAKVTVTERNFKASNVLCSITNTDGVLPNVNLNDERTWTTSGEGDNTQHVAVFEYAADGDYKFNLSCKDNANNSSNTVQSEFTIDKTIPTVNVEYDNNNVRNGKYYKDTRVATITVNEHNFDPNRVTIIGTASATAFPSLSGWSSSGNIHYATITYSGDSDYTFDIDVRDMAGNASVDFIPHEFCVDKTLPKLEISGVGDESANSGSENIGFSISATDINLDTFSPIVSVVKYSDGGFSTDNVYIGQASPIAGGMQYSVANLELDGIYSITCTVIDKAGNAYDSVIIRDANGNTKTERRSGTDQLITFSVNRNGSVFDMDTYSKGIVDKGYVKEVSQSISIVEINADTINQSAVSLNGKQLESGKEYTVSLDKTSGTWNRYNYSLNKSLFEKEGEYIIVVSSVDKAENKAFSDVKNLSVKFVVDKTAPIINVSGLVTNGRYRTDKQTVTVIPSDDGGALKSIKVQTVDESGKTIKELVSLSDEELYTTLADGNITFELEDGLYQNVLIVCDDVAGNSTSDNSEKPYFFRNVSVTTSAFLIFWANKPLRWGCIAGLVVIIAAAIVFVIIKKKK